jgi:hypothetical protein
MAASHSNSSPSLPLFGTEKAATLQGRACSYVQSISTRHAPGAIMNHVRLSRDRRRGSRSRFSLDFSDELAGLGAGVRLKSGGVHLVAVVTCRGTCRF